MTNEQRAALEQAAKHSGAYHVFIRGAEWMEQQPIEFFVLIYHSHTGIGTIDSPPEYYRTEQEAHEAYKDDLSVGMGVNDYSIKKIITT